MIMSIAMLMPTFKFERTYYADNSANGRGNNRTLYRTAARRSPPHDCGLTLVLVGLSAVPRFGCRLTSHLPVELIRDAKFPIDSCKTFGCTRAHGEAISPQGDMPKNRVRSSARDASCLLFIRLAPTNLLA